MPGKLGYTRPDGSIPGEDIRFAITFGRFFLDCQRRVSWQLLLQGDVFRGNLTPYSPNPSSHIMAIALSLKSIMIRFVAFVNLMPGMLYTD